MFASFVKDDTARNGPALMACLILAYLIAGCAPARRNALPPPSVRRVAYAHQPLPPGTFSSPGTLQPNVPAAWVPPARLANLRSWRAIIIHHSASEGGNLAEIDRWHKQRGWDGVGYHFVIDNGDGATDGRIEVGFRWRQQREGAHCRPRPDDDNYWNEHAIGICLVGDFDKKSPSPAQYDALARLVRFLQKRYDIPPSQIKGHGHVPGAITHCPGRHFSWAQLRRRLR